MTSSLSLSKTNLPLPSLPGGEVIPIHIVTHASQLPHEFLNPSPDKKLVIGFDCEGVDLCRNGTLCIMQLAFPDAIYLVDAIEGGRAIVEACKPALESSYITKVIHDCKRDSEALYFQFNIRLNNVFDTQIAYALIEEQEGGTKVPDDYISFVGLLADPRYCGMSYLEKQEVRVLLRQDPNFWKYRPLSELMVRAATDDVRFLLYIYKKMAVKMNQKSFWKYRPLSELEIQHPRPTVLKSLIRRHISIIHVAEHHISMDLTQAMREVLLKKSFCGPYHFYTRLKNLLSNKQDQPSRPVAICMLKTS